MIYMINDNNVNFRHIKAEFCIVCVGLDFLTYTGSVLAAWDGFVTITKDFWGISLGACNQ